jgi:hypothetical protein
MSRPAHQPRLEALEDRSCPTAVSFSNGVLTITGDTNVYDTLNSVGIVQNDDTNTLTVYYDDFTGTPHTWMQTFASSEVQVIKVSLGSNADTFSYTMQSGFLNLKMLDVNMGSGFDKAYLAFGDVNAYLNIKLNMGMAAANDVDWVDIGFGDIDNAYVHVAAYMGGGDDKFNAHLNGDLKNGADVDFDVFGQGGNDELRVYLGYSLPKVNGGSEAVPMHIGSEAKLDVSMDGGAGEDTVAIYGSAEIDGTLSHHLVGGDGVDIVLPWFAKVAGSTGQVIAY